jgi:hypothetical protein
MIENRLIGYDFVLSADENRTLFDLFREIEASPYTDYERFLDTIEEIRVDPRLPPRFRDFCDLAMNRDFREQPLIVVGNSPIDPDLPVFDSKNPVKNKYETKRTFIAEAYLALYGRLTATQIIGHLSVNGGDFFHDIYPKESMFETQSQKTLGTLRFHRDFANHFVSPDFVVTLTLRDTPANEVYSTFTPTAVAEAALDERDRAVLRQERFHTPFDDVSLRENEVRLGEARAHAVLSDDDGARVFEGRTKGLDEEAQEALDAFIGALHEHKRLRVGVPGDSVSFSNRHVVHGREVRQVRDLDELRKRWLMKTHNVFSLSAFEEFFLADRYGVVNG